MCREMKFIGRKQKRLRRCLAIAAAVAFAMAGSSLGAVGKSWGNSAAGVGVDFSASNWDVFGAKTGVKLAGKVTGHAMYLSADLVHGWAQVSENNLGNSRVWNYGLDVMDRRILSTTSWFVEAPPQTGWSGPWNQKTYSHTIPIGPLPPIVVSAGYSVAPGFKFKPVITAAGVSATAAPELTAIAKVSGAMDAALLRGGIAGDLTLLSGGIEALLSYNLHTDRQALLDWRPYLTALKGRIYAYAQHISGFKCSWSGCRRTWSTFWDQTIASSGGISWSLGWHRLWSSVL